MSVRDSEWHDWPGKDTNEAILEGTWWFMMAASIVDLIFRLIQVIGWPYY